MFNNLKLVVSATTEIDEHMLDLKLAETGAELNGLLMELRVSEAVKEFGVTPAIESIVGFSLDQATVVAGMENLITKAYDAVKKVVAWIIAKIKGMFDIGRQLKETADRRGSIFFMLVLFLRMW